MRRDLIDNTAKSFLLLVWILRIVVRMPAKCELQNFLRLVAVREHVDITLKITAGRLIFRYFSSLGGARDSCRERIVMEAN